MEFLISLTSLSDLTDTMNGKYHIHDTSSSKERLNDTQTLLSYL